MRQLVRLRTRPSRDGNSFTYLLDYVDEDGKRKRISLGHSDRRKAERQRVQKERELQMGLVGPESMRISDFLEDSLVRTGGQIRESTRHEYRSAMGHFINVVGDIDLQKIGHKHGELFRQVCLDEGNSPATVAKKLRHVKRLFQLAVERKQLDENPVRQVKLPRSPAKKVVTFSPEQCERILRAAQDYQGRTSVRWDLIIALALITGMRRGELLNTIWPDIDFEAKTVEVSPKKNTDRTWEWHIKDTDRRVLPLTDEIVSMLAGHQSRQPDGYPYVFVTPSRYDRIQQLRKTGKWNICDARLKIINNFSRHFNIILERAGINGGQFHDMRRTALTNWFANGLRENDVRVLAGHSSFATTHRFYLAVADDLVDRAREAVSHGIGKNLARIWHAPCFDAPQD
jgi:integrase